MVTLPPPSAPVLKSFWLSITILGGFIAGGILSLWESLWGVTGVGFCLVVAVGGLRVPWIMYGSYKVWVELVSRFASGARFVLMGICFYFILFAVGRTGSSLNLERPPSYQTLWVSRRTTAPSAYGSQSGFSDESFFSRGWVGNFFHWAFRSGNLWACGLLPFLYLLSLLETGKDSSVPSDIYTLY